MRLALVGAGNIADRYAAAIVGAEGLELAGVTDRLPARAEAIAAAFGGTVYPSLASLLADEAVDTVVNLTAPQAHFEVTAAALDAGKHVHSEKPLALTHDDARELVARAEKNGVRLSSAPSTLLGEAQQTAWKLVREGAIGRVRAVYAEANWDRLESWHPDPRALYAVGPLVDVGVYPLTIMTAMFGPARRVHAFASMLEAHRKLLDGTPFTPKAPDFVVANIELSEGVLARLTATFYVGPSKQRGLELHGDDGSLYMPTWAEANSRLEQQARGGEYATVAPIREPFPGIDWGRALLDLAAAIDEGRPHRSSGEHAAHVVEVFDAIRSSVDRDGAAVEVRSDFPRPEPMEWAQ
ncbi:MAG TPA: Gfo/Idh/MocA family oxidoreductase [Gaiellaceae bacterium]|nr:Gfo/Idh/MocA family oxidoreductase [Gaiellaceae bacterium]